MADDSIENKNVYSCKDLQQHIIALEEAGLLHRIDEEVNKDTELHALVRWQFRGGIAEKDRKAFYFSNVVDFCRRPCSDTPTHDTLYAQITCAVSMSNSLYLQDGRGCKH